MLFLGWNTFKHNTPNLGANPVEFITNETGTSTLVLLLISLGVTPLRRITGWNWVIRFRRLLGLFAFFYGLLHLATYIVLDREFDWAGILKDVLKRPFITYGVLAFTIMLLLAATSTNWAIRKMGGKNWNTLHRTVYFSGVASILHFWFKQKADHSEPFVYGSILASLLLFRVGLWWKEKRNSSPPLASDN
jgi:sulfoxide reductase heme-binding subunit YedZ